MVMPAFSAVMRVPTMMTGGTLRKRMPMSEKMPTCAPEVSA